MSSLFSFAVFLQGKSGTLLPGSVSKLKGNWPVNDHRIRSKQKARLRRVENRKQLVRLRFQPVVLGAATPTDDRPEARSYEDTSLRVMLQTNPVLPARVATPYDNPYQTNRQGPLSPTVLGDESRCRTTSGKRSPLWRIIAAVLCLPQALASTARATDIDWSIASGKTNLLSNGSSMTSDFRFELGVFRDGFVPTASNKGQWASKWSAAQRAAYNATSGIFSGQFTVENNSTPFSVGANAWVWGFRGEYGSGEWILFRKSDWNWPAPNPFNPFPTQWSATAADVVVLGTVTSGGIQSASVAGVLPPETSWAVWQEIELEATSLKAPGDDADGDGTSNLLEFVFGTDPLRADRLPALTLSSILVSGQPYMRVSVPRRADRAANVVVEVSGDLEEWFSGPTYVEILGDTPDALIVRDLSVLGSSRFARVRATLP